MIRLIAILFALFLPAWACAQEYPAGSIPVATSSGTVAAGTAAATLTAAPHRTNFLCGMAITSTGSTGAAVVAPTISNILGAPSNTLTFAYASVAGATLGNQPLVVNFSPCLKASLDNTAITVSVPSLGSGNTNSTVNIWGYRF